MEWPPFHTLLFATIFVICGVEEQSIFVTCHCGLNLPAGDRTFQDPCCPGEKWDSLFKKCQSIQGTGCYQCYPSQFPQEANGSLEDCLVQSVEGSPDVLSEYWTSCFSQKHIPVDYRTNAASQFEVTPRVEYAIKRLHKAVGNADTEGYTVVYGSGASDILFMTITALSHSILDKCVEAGRSDCPFAVDVFVQMPYYYGYTVIVDRIRTARMNVLADTSSEFTIEIVTCPNNPTGELMKPLVQDGSHVIHDMVYYWPMYTDTTEMMSAEIMIFSTSKYFGLAGSRFGWGLFKDYRLANQIEYMRHGDHVSEHAMLITYNMISRVLSQSPSPVTGMLPYHQFVRAKIFSAFSRLSDAMKDCKGMDIQLTNDITHSPGVYAWLRCASGVQCADEVRRLTGIDGYPGELYASTNQMMRLSMDLPSVEMDIMIKRFYKLCA